MKTAAQAAAKWKTNAGAAQQTYIDGITATSVDVMGRAVAQSAVAAQAYVAVMTSGAYARAVQASGGTANWKAKSEAKAPNYLTGINAGADAQATAIAKILQDMPGIVNGLPARGPVGSAQNYQRSAAVGQALHANKGKYKS